MADYKKVTEALESGADPAMLCMTCPWDRFCITPPTMTSAEVKAEVDKASEADREAREKAKAEGKDAGMPMGMLLTAVLTGGRDTSASCCPVLAVRLRSVEGEQVVKALRTQMKEWAS